MNTELIKEIERAFYKQCDNYSRCKVCKYIRAVCKISFTLDYLAEHGMLRNSEKSAEKEDNPAEKNAEEPTQETKLPAWCKVGQWVVSKAELKLHQSVVDCSLKQIDEVDSDGHIFFKTRGARISSCWELYVPVCFRPYTYEEAKKLIGKVMEYTDKTAYSYTMLISRVSHNANGADVYIQSCRYTNWADSGATIDGVPIGVPEVDEEAQKGGEE